MSINLSREIDGAPYGWGDRIDTRPDDLHLHMEVRARDRCDDSCMYIGGPRGMRYSLGSRGRWDPPPRATRIAAEELSSDVCGSTNIRDRLGTSRSSILFCTLNLHSPLSSSSASILLLRGGRRLASSGFCWEHRPMTGLAWAGPMDT